jgi:hypothetical protein
MKQKLSKAQAVVIGLKVCQSINGRREAFKRTMDKERDFEFRGLAKACGLSFDDFCDEMETLSALDC